MTPLVDIAFLLLTFFMFTTTMAQPQVMEMSIPPQTDVVDVKESQIFEIQVRGDGAVFYRYQGGDFQPIKMDAVRKMAVQYNLEQKNELITSLKVSKEAKYDQVINILDALNMAEGDIVSQLGATKRERKFAFVPLTEEEELKLKEL